MPVVLKLKKKKMLDIVGTTLINNIDDIVLIYLLLLSLYNLFIYKKKNTTAQLIYQWVIEHSILQLDSM